jgi:hypothetical protein
MAKLKPGDPLHQAAAMRAAELIVASEDMRARLRRSAAAATRGASIFKLADQSRP